MVYDDNQITPRTAWGAALEGGSGETGKNQKLAEKERRGEEGKKTRIG